MAFFFHGVEELHDTDRRELIDMIEKMTKYTQYLKVMVSIHEGDEFQLGVPHRVLDL